MAAQPGYQYEYEEGYEIASHVHDREHLDPMNSSSTSKLVKPSIMKEARRRVGIFCLTLIFMALLIMLVRCICACEGYALVSMQAKARDLERENAELQVSNSFLKNTGRIKQIAEEKLHMHIPQKAYFAKSKSE